MKLMYKYKKIMVRTIISKIYNKIKQKQKSGISDEDIINELTDAIYDYLRGHGYI